jgi:hypothetical protein
MPVHPYKVRLRRVRGDIIYELLVPKSTSGWYVKERINLHVPTLPEAVPALKLADLAKLPLTAALLIPADT